ncbi:PPOX class F420-dependent oxidoreductase [Amnibacterium flavum]|uniref:PPOX class F420-dependent oxidoreductase n=1 Tax=Amnibacterium flavum TaxID=2173173 RepID=A0A2V1HM09_9MICO|nr:PPOX class F420-dependent oxidoreductase [Amnibacterium flavum]
MLALENERFVSLTTFRKSGEGVSTPVWIARDGDALLVTTPSDTGKVKRVRNNARVELAPSGRMGKVADGATPAVGDAVIVTEPGEVDRCSAIFAAKYGFEYKIFMWIERRGKAGQKPRVMLRIT